MPTFWILIFVNLIRVFYNLVGVIYQKVKLLSRFLIKQMFYHPRVDINLLIYIVD